MLLTFLKRTSATLDQLAEWTGRFTAWLALGVVLVTFTVVVLRYGFSIGSIALQESILYLHSSLFLLGAAYTLKHDAHVRVDIFYREFSPQRKAWADLFGSVFLLIPICVFLLWVSRDYVANSWALREGSGEAGGLEYVYLLKTLIPVSITLLMLQGISQMFSSMVLLLNDGGDAS